MPASADPVNAAVAAPSSSAALGDDVLATVNGVPIRESDLHYVLARDKGKGKGVSGEKAKEVLEALIAQEHPVALGGAHNGVASGWWLVDGEVIDGFDVEKERHELVAR